MADHVASGDVVVVREPEGEIRYRFDRFDGVWACTAVVDSEGRKIFSCRVLRDQIDHQILMGAEVYRRGVRL